ncbi:hypothetical protein [Bacillus sp. 2205SS5-2]|uniref:hypothetical protein n=1 Tax=Bacillus sp. 2205SS5-2 TaxID=3109031 RepID=UPI003006B339
MLGLLLAAILFNLIAFKTNKRLTKNQIIHIWTFTLTFQLLFDCIIDIKYSGYWYFTTEFDWFEMPARLVLIPPVNMIFLNYFPFKKAFIRKIYYLFGWDVMLILYELITLLPEPYGYFYYGWWSLWYSLIINPLLLICLLNYYKWIYQVEMKSESGCPAASGK